MKIASLESLLFRRTEADSKIGGTLYTRGNVYDTNGTPLDADDLLNSDLKGWAIDGVTGKINQNTTTGAMSVTGLVDASEDTEGYLDDFANLYQDYPTDDEHMTDGNLPTHFPAPFPDDDGDRIIDDSEFDAVADSLYGTINGGYGVGVPEGSVYTQSALPNSTTPGLIGGVTNAHEGNLVLVGTDSNPIVIDGNVAVDGDLVLSGVIKGKGTMRVRGNTYVVGDVTYADAPGEFGVALDGTENAFGLIAGGSIMMGDYLSVRGKSHPEDQSKYPDSTKSIKVRDQNKTSTQTKNGTTVTLNIGYFDPGVVDAGEFDPTMLNSSGAETYRQRQQFSFTTSELMLFNNLEVDKALADPNYQPRFYGLREGQPDNLWVYDDDDEHSVRYDEGGITVPVSGGVKQWDEITLNNPTTKLIAEYIADQPNAPDDIEAFMDNATIHYMNPDANWMSEDTLRQIWWDDEQTRPSSKRAFKFDGLLYSNNAIFALTRSTGRHNSNQDGQMQLRGGIISADLGMLIPVGLDLFYDPRVKDFYQLEDPTQVEFARGVYLHDS